MGKMLGTLILLMMVTSGIQWPRVIWISGPGAAQEKAAPASSEAPTPDPSILKPEESEQIRLAFTAAQDAELDYERAAAQRDTSLKEIQRLTALIVGDHGIKPSLYGISADLLHIQLIEQAQKASRSAKETAKKPPGEGSK